MRELIRSAIEGARDQMVDLTQSVQGDGKLSPDTVLQRYVQQHRGKPEALMEFARRMAPAGANVFDEAARYEEEMERLLRARGG